MKKSFVIILFVLCIFISFNDRVFADSKQYKSNDGYQFTISKDNFLYAGDAAYQEVGHMSFSIGEYLVDNTVPVYFITSKSDPIISDPDKWWATLFMCEVAEGGFGSVGADEIVMITTDSLNNSLTGDSVDKVLWLFGDAKYCTTLVVQGVDKGNQVSYCGYYADKEGLIEDIHNKYSSNKSPKYKSEYKKEVETLRTACSQALSAASYNEACVVRCLHFEDDVLKWNDWFGVQPINNNCGLTQRLLNWIHNIINWVKYIAPVLVILIGIVDFIRAVASAKEDEMKKAQGRFIKRLIAAALVFIVPLLLSFVFEKMGFVVEDCGIMGL